jgi:guanylate kinase
MPNLVLSVSATSRAPRTTEVEGQDYFFLSQDEFQRRIQAQEFLEWAQYNGHYYGTLKAPVQAWLAQGKSVFLEIDVQGALQVKQNAPEATLIFLAPPSLAVLQERLALRGTNTPEDMARRVSIAAGELEQQAHFDWVLVNENLDEAFESLVRWMSGR